jgi:hypothetical protein
MAYGIASGERFLKARINVSCTKSSRSARWPANRNRSPLTIPWWYMTSASNPLRSPDFARLTFLRSSRSWVSSTTTGYLPKRTGTIWPETNLVALSWQNNSHCCGLDFIQIGIRLPRGQFPLTHEPCFRSRESERVKEHQFCVIVSVRDWAVPFGFVLVTVRFTTPPP